MKKHWEQSGSLPSPSCSFQHALLFISVTSCFAEMVTFLVRSKACCAVVNKLSTLFGFPVHCETRDLNISLDELLFIQVFKGNFQPSLERLFIVKCSHFSVSVGLHSLKPTFFAGPAHSALQTPSCILASSTLEKAFALFK